MITMLPSQFMIRLSLLTAFLSACAMAADAPNTTTTSPLPQRPRSVFVDDARDGKDPFYPNSARRLAVLAQAAATNAVPSAALPTYSFSLRGISKSTTQPLALINNATLAVGEEAEVKSGQQPVKIICREIRDRSVVIEIVATGEIREVKLREGI